MQGFPVRIIGGEFRGRALKAPASGTIRPTSDRVRESLFNVITHSYSNALEQTRVLDLFAGTGALGIEALSRGARFCLFVDNSIEGRAVLRQNVELFDLQGSSRIFRRDATQMGDIEKLAPFDLVFADPPYGQELGEKAIASARNGRWFSPNALLVVEEQKISAPQALDGFERLEQRHYSSTTIGIFRLK